MNYSFVDPLERVNNLTQASTEWYEESPGHLASRTGKEIIPTYDLRTALEMCFAYADTLNKYIDTTKPWTLE
jgi:methionyl-tRNA synthetase